jgi:transcriptional regulator with XRE-family HTH domain
MPVPVTVAPETEQQVIIALGERIRALVAETDTYAADFAARTGIGTAHLSMIVNGHKDIKISTLLRIAQGLHIKLSTLLRGIEPEPPRRRRKRKPPTDPLLAALSRAGAAPPG